MRRRSRRCRRRPPRYRTAERPYCFSLTHPLRSDILRLSSTPHWRRTMSVAPESVLTDRLLEKCRERAPKYDQENRFCQEDFDELKAAGYLMMAVPREFG